MSLVLGMNKNERGGLQYIYGSVYLELSKRTNVSWGSEGGVIWHAQYVVSTVRVYCSLFRRDKSRMVSFFFAAIRCHSVECGWTHGASWFDVSV